MKRVMKFEITNFQDLNYMGHEAFNTLCANLSFAGGDIKKIMVTSCNPQDGKSFVSMNLMRSFSQMGLKVLLIDADIRASILQKRYGIKIDESGYKGLTEYLAGRAKVEEIIAQTDIPNADMILAGKTVNISFPLINSGHLEELLDAVVNQYDIIVVDTPPIGAIIDAALIASHCDGVLLVLRSNFTTQQELKDAISQIERSGKPILGTVLNRFDTWKFGKKSESHKYYYSNYYYRDNEKKTDGKKKKKVKTEK